MALESMTEQFTEFGQQASESYWKAVDQVSETAERMADSFLASVPGLPEESVQWLNNWRSYNKQGMEAVKQKLNSFSNSTPSFEMPREYSEKALKAYTEQVNRWFEQAAAFQEKGRTATDEFTEKFPEPAKQWLKQWQEMSDKGVETLKSMMLGEFDAAELAKGFQNRPAADTQPSKKGTGKTTEKNKTN